MEIIIDGREIKTERDFHLILQKKLDLGPYYGRNLDAMWDFPTTEIENPVKIIWLFSEQSRKKLGERFDNIIKVLQDVEEHDKHDLIGRSL